MQNWNANKAVFMQEEESIEKQFLILFWGSIWRTDLAHCIECVIICVSGRLWRFHHPYTRRRCFGALNMVRPFPMGAPSTLEQSEQQALCVGHDALSFNHLVMMKMRNIQVFIVVVPSFEKYTELGKVSCVKGLKSKLQKKHVCLQRFYKLVSYERAMKIRKKEWYMYHWNRPSRSRDIWVQSKISEKNSEN